MAFLRAALVPATGPVDSLTTSRVLEAIVDKVVTFGSFFIDADHHLKGS